jgi:Rieske Fe-S protein
MKHDKTNEVDRRQLLGAGVAGAALLAIPAACSSSSDDTDGGGDAARDVAKEAAKDVTTMEAGPDATLVDGGGACKQDDWTHPISIMKAGIAVKGTAYAFTDDRYSDVTGFGENRILVINPLTGSGYVAMSGVCTHMGCCPEYFAKCVYSTPESTMTPQCVELADGGFPEAGFDAGTDGGGSDGGSDAASDAPSDAASDGADAFVDGGQPTLMTDVLFCPCHQSVYDAKNGKAIMGPATNFGDLQLMDTCTGGGYVFVTIPDNGLGAGSAPNCSSSEGHEP